MSRDEMIRRVRAYLEWLARPKGPRVGATCDVYVIQPERTPEDDFNEALPHILLLLLDEPRP
jgi:hypothetical protein